MRRLHDFDLKHFSRVPSSQCSFAGLMRVNRRRRYVTRSCVVNILRFSFSNICRPQFFQFRAARRRASGLLMPPMPRYVDLRRRGYAVSREMPIGCSRELA